MTSYVKFIASNSSYSGKTWLDSGCSTFEEYLDKLTGPDLLRFVADQSLAVSYYCWLYGAQANEFVGAYAKSLEEIVKNRLETANFEGAVKGILESVKSIQACWFSLNWIDFPIKAFITYVYDLANRNEAPYPVAFSKGIVVPYLMHRTNVVQAGCESYTGDVFIPKFTLCNWTGSGCLNVVALDAGRGFVAKIRDNDPVFAGNKDLVRMYNVCIKRCGVPIIQFLSKTCPNNRYFDYTLSLLADLLPWYEYRPDLSSNYQLFYAIASLLNCLFSSDFIDVDRQYGRLAIADGYCEGATKVVFDLLTFINKVYGVKVRNAEMFNRVFHALMQRDRQVAKTTQQIIEYVEESGAQVASVENLNAWNQSIYAEAGCEAIELISQKSTILTQDSGAEETGEESEDEDESEFNVNEIPGIDEADPALEAAAEEDEDTSTDDDENGEDDSSENEGGSGDDGNADPTEGEDDPSKQGSDPAGAGDDNAAANSDTQTANAKPEDIDASEDDGIEFAFAPEGSETVDSVVFREELDKFISNLLINPPKKLSIQTVAALTKLQKCWIHLLSVGTIVGILEKLVALPDKFKTIKQHME